MSVHVINEARRCLQCKKPLCRIEGCPAQTNIPEMIHLFLTGRINEAGAMLFENNPMSVVCSLVCDHEAQCEGHCIQGRRGAPVQISSIESYISDTYLDKAHLTIDLPRGKRVAVVGSGPAGLTVAVTLRQRGYDVTIFERMSYIGGMMRYGIPDFRLPKSILDRYVKKLVMLGIHIRPNTTIGGALTLDTLLSDGYEAIFVGTGVWRPRRLGIHGESLGNCLFAVDYLKSPDSCHLGERVAVIGAGNSAMDVARTAIRRGSRFVTVYCRDPKVTASQREFEYAEADGVDFVYNQEVDEISPQGPMLREVHRAEDGTAASIDEPKLHRADSTIIAVSQVAKDKIYRGTTGIAVNKNGLLEVNEDGSTTREGIFAGGDVVLGAKNVIQAVKNAKHVADSIDRYLMDKDRD